MDAMQRRGQNQGNREKIVRAAISLLDEKGYDAVSMRDVAQLAGIRASSIYNHFDGKDAMLDAVAAAFEAELDERGINRPDPEADMAGALGDPKALLLSIMTAPLALLEDAYTARIIRIVSRCQFHHAGIRAFLQREMFDVPRERIRTALEVLRQRGLLKEREGWTTDFLTAELQAVFVADYYRLVLDGSERAPDPQAVRRAMAAHVDFFWQAAGVMETREC
jgi:AcrR family transcriptional regulator